MISEVVDAVEWYDDDNDDEYEDDDDELTVVPGFMLEGRACRPF